MKTLISPPFTIFSSFDTASALATANAEADDGTEYRVIRRDDGRFVVAMYEDGEFMMNL